MSSDGHDSECESRQEVIRHDGTDYCVACGGAVSGPSRIQRKRTRGWRMPEGAVYVGRPSKWGNPYGVSGETTALIATRMFRDMLNRAPTGDTGTGWSKPGETVFGTIRRELAGRDLACWCPLVDESGQRVPCHADVLLDLANRGDA